LASSTTGGENYTVGWNENGNMASVSAPARSFVYNWDNKLRSGQKDTTSSIDLIKYDLMGNRIWKQSTLSSLTTARKYIVDVSGGLPTILMEIDPADSLIKKSYFYANGEVLMQYNGNHKADKYFYLHDRLGSVREIINTSGSVVHHYTYGPFGQTIESSHESQAPSNDFLFTGQWFDPEIGQYYLRARQYDPVLMRFSSRDPVFGKFEEPMTLHKYLYCGNEPVNRIDPVGLWWEKVHNQIIDIAFGGNNSWGELQTYDIKRGSAYVDSSQFQDSAHAYMHAMIPNPSEPWGNTREPWSREKTIDKMVGFIITELEQSNCNTELGNIRLAGFHLGEAAHPLMDFTSPAHSLKLWGGDPDEYLSHYGERKISERDLRDAATFTRTTLEMLNNDTQALSGWDW